MFSLSTLTIMTNGILVVEFLSLVVLFAYMNANGMVTPKPPLN
jgi:hypothetical protein